MSMSAPGDEAAAIAARDADAASLRSRRRRDADEARRADAASLRGARQHAAAWGGALGRGRRRGVAAAEKERPRLQRLGAGQGALVAGVLRFGRRGGLLHGVRARSGCRGRGRRVDPLVAVHQLLEPGEQGRRQLLKIAFKL